MKHKGFSFFLCLGLVAACCCLCSAEDDFHEFVNREEEALVHCVHDSAPRFGKRICDCGYRNEDFVTPQFDGSTTEIEIANCKSLRVRRETFSQLFQLTKLTIINVEDLVLESSSLDFTRNAPSARLKIELINNVIEEVPSHLVKGPIAEISFIRCRIGVFKPFSIASVHEQLYSLRIVESLINRIERHAFKRFEVSELTLNGSKFISSIPSQSFYEVEVLENFLITNCSFNAILPSAFAFKNVTKLNIRNNEFNDAAGESFVLQIKKSVSIIGNYFAKIEDTVLRGINLDSSYYSRNSERPTLQFHNNRIGRINGEKLLIFSDDFDVNFRAIYVEQSIDCSQMITLKESSILANHPDEIYFGSSHDGNDFKSFQDIKRFRCAEDRFWFFLIIGAVAGSIVLVIIALLVSWYCVAQKRKKQRKLQVVMPEPRTYRETQIVMQIENHGLLKTDL
ncbi:AAEL004070-PA [Aedes aegypti]|uniref:AAEL004070-PA n=1 Tax=Aedes aegypti TaxID=7159 RepID=Q17DR9_AEDAE|nr:AAEL004070-PA [Aedes aegypti]